jgi:hypothetical protein
MAITNEYPIYNGIAPSWADVSARITPEGAPLCEMRDLAAVNLARSIEVGWQRGTGGGKRRRTTGQPDEEGSITFYRYGFDDCLVTLTTAAEAQGFVRGNQVLVSLVVFDIEVKHTPPGSDRIFHRIGRGCRFISDALAAAEGTDADQIEVGLSVAQIVDIVNGKEIVLL